MKQTVVLLVSILLLASCMPNKDERQIEDTALLFAKNYFECHYHEALQMCTPESGKWLQFVASNISDSDLSVLNNSTTEPEYKISNITYIDDSTVQVKVEASNYLYTHRIERKAFIKEHGTYTVALKRIHGEWRIDLLSVPKEDQD